jgi:tRNA (cytosine34-C5)-methyltransferase
MVYSTCSMNPVENEAIVYNLLLKFKGQLELCDVREKLNGLKTINGLLKWNLMNKSSELYDTFDKVKENERNLIRPYMFPPDIKLAKELNLERCIRILPHHQNTGGFFIAVLRKLPHVKADLDLDSQYLSAKADEKPQREMKAPAAKRLKQVFDENPFEFADKNEKLLSDWKYMKFVLNFFFASVFAINFGNYEAKYTCYVNILENFI